MDVIITTILKVILLCVGSYKFAISKNSGWLLLPIIAAFIAGVDMAGPNEHIWAQLVTGQATDDLITQCILRGGLISGLLFLCFSIAFIIPKKEQ